MQRILSNGVPGAKNESLSDLLNSLVDLPLNALMERVADHLSIDRVCVSHNIHDRNNDIVNREFESVGDGVDLLDNEIEKVMSHIESAASPIMGKCSGNNEQFDFWGCVIKAKNNRSNTIIFFTKDNQLTLLNGCSQALTMAACLLSITEVRVSERVTINELQHNMRYQVIWSECLEWLKTVEYDESDFFMELLTRAELLTEASASALYIVEGDGFKETWSNRKLTRQQLIELNGMFKEVNLFEVDQPHVINDLKQFQGGHRDSNQLSNLMVIPMNFGERLGAIFYLANKSDQRPFGVMDEVYLSQILAQAYTNIEKKQLLDTLQQRNNALKDEQAEQQKLITKLQSAQSQLLQSEKMASIGQLAAGVAHEINNPIGYVSSNLTSLGTYTKEIIEVLDKVESACVSAGDESLINTIQRIKADNDIEFLRDDLIDLQKESLEGINRVKQIVQDLKDFSHISDEEMVFSDLIKGLDSTLNIVHNELKYKAKIEKLYDAIPLVQCVPSQINQVFMNLLVNAGHAIDKNGEIKILTRKEGANVKVTISDNGHGIDKNNLNKLFEPFFTTKPVGKGTGLGLSLSYSIVTKHNGTIEVESELGKGTSFTVTLPIQQPEEEVGGK